MSYLQDDKRSASPDAVEKGINLGMLVNISS